MDECKEQVRETERVEMRIRAPRRRHVQPLKGWERRLI